VELQIINEGEEDGKNEGKDSKKHGKFVKLIVINV
jgi:hypothetical protein